MIEVRQHMMCNFSYEVLHAVKMLLVLATAKLVVFVFLFVLVFGLFYIGAWSVIVLQHVIQHVFNNRLY